MVELCEEYSRGADTHRRRKSTDIAGSEVANGLAGEAE